MGPGGAGGVGSSPALVTRINEKKEELENLTQLRDLSAQLAGQMETLKGRVEVLGRGTEAVAAVLANWHNVLRAISMASTKLPQPAPSTAADGTQQEEATSTKKVEGKIPLPATLVRIPVEEQGKEGEAVGGGGGQQEWR
ncbi:hypothetical protein MMC10_011319 [Thelotrema lepadinum]|nr:hypothetical protein [Thelotrema lepadinum]